MCADTPARDFFWAQNPTQSIQSSRCNTDGDYNRIKGNKSQLQHRARIIQVHNVTDKFACWILKLNFEVQSF